MISPEKGAGCGSKVVRLRGRPAHDDAWHRRKRPACSGALPAQFPLASVQLSTHLLLALFWQPRTAPGGGGLGRDGPLWLLSGGIVPGSGAGTGGAPAARLADQVHRRVVAIVLLPARAQGVQRPWLRSAIGGAANPAWQLAQLSRTAAAAGAELDTAVAPAAHFWLGRLSGLGADTLPSDTMRFLRQGKRSELACELIVAGRRHERRQLLALARGRGILPGARTPARGSVPGAGAGNPGSCRAAAGAHGAADGGLALQARLPASCGACLLPG